jgi:hypothetical protein
MPRIVFGDDRIDVDASLIAEGLGVEPARVQPLMQEGKVTSLCERGVDEDAGTYRLTFFTASRRLRMIVNEAGEVVRRSAVTSRDQPLSAKMRRPGI